MKKFKQKTFFPGSMGQKHGCTLYTEAHYIWYMRLKTNEQDGSDRDLAMIILFTCILGIRATYSKIKCPGSIYKIAEWPKKRDKFSNYLSQTTHLWLSNKQKNSPNTTSICDKHKE